jgi:IclR family acetate operon transcriptional repressor
MSTSTPPASTRTVDRALTLLEFVVTAEQPPTLAECGRAAGLALSTASRLLGTLTTQGFVRRAVDGRFWPGTRMLRSAAVCMRRLPVFDLSEEHLRALADETGETAYLLVAAEPGTAVYLRQVESAAAIRHASWLGRTIPLAGTATGAALAGDVGDVGYATNRGAVEPDSATAAAPVHEAAGGIGAVISVIAPAFRVDDDRLHEIGRMVASHARTLSAPLGAQLVDAPG